MGYQKNAFLGAASLSTTIHSCTSVTIVTRHNDIVSVLVQRKQHPPLKARRVARIGGSLFAVAALCLFLSCFRSLQYRYSSENTFLKNLPRLYVLLVRVERDATHVG